MTYGWAIALVVIIAAVLFAMGVFDTSNFVGSKAAGFSGVAVSSWQLTPGGVLNMVYQNQVGKSINIMNTTATVAGVGANNTSTFAMATGASHNTQLTGFTAQAAGSAYTAAVTIVYNDTSSGFVYTTQGTLTGKVS